jgi:hypothetical protein
MIWGVSFGLNSGWPTVLKILNRPVKSYDFTNRVALDVKPVSLIWRILLYTAGPYSGPSQHVEHVYFVKLCI